MLLHALFIFLDLLIQLSLHRLKITLSIIFLKESVVKLLFKLLKLLSEVRLFDIFFIKCF